jgi:hypothetical protein
VKKQLNVRILQLVALLAVLGPFFYSQGAFDLARPVQAQTLAAIVSDDFNSCTLDPRWEFVNPLDDSTMAMTGTQVNLTVAGGTSHNVFDNGIPAPRIMQEVNDGDFEVLVKFDSVVSQRYQVQGVLVVQDLVVDAEDFIRFDFFHDGANVHFYAAAIRNGVPLPQIDLIVTPTAGAYYMKVQREGNTWTLSYSFDNINYTSRNFTLTTPLTMTQIGLFAANHGGANIPEHTAVVDYFFNTASPINDEDGKPTTLGLTAQPLAGGVVTVTTPTGKTNYACGEEITVTAIPANGFRFEQWSGSVEGTTNPVTFAYNIGDTVTAEFVEGQSQEQLYLPLVRGR